jgi:hypothetical protein
LAKIVSVRNIRRWWVTGRKRGTGFKRILFVLSDAPEANFGAAPIKWKG